LLPNPILPKHTSGWDWFSRDLENFKKTAESYNKVLSFGLNAPDIFNNLGNSLKETGELEKAVACYKKALKANPNYFVGHFNLGNVHHMKGESCRRLPPASKEP
jgi:tetratricopeptide (TPR) repeat protein